MSTLASPAYSHDRKDDAASVDSTLDCCDHNDEVSWSTAITIKASNAVRRQYCVHGLLFNRQSKWIATTEFGVAANAVIVIICCFSHAQSCPLCRQKMATEQAKGKYCRLLCDDVLL